MSKKRDNSTCYMCDKPATSDEHVPPRCIFPEVKDLPPGVDYRRNLFTVPACDDHNLKCSIDDEIFYNILTTNYFINEDGRNLYRSKTRRAIKRNPSFLLKLNEGSLPVRIEDSGEIEHVRALFIEKDQINRIIEKLGKAIYFLHYNQKWLTDFRYHIEFLLLSKNFEEHKGEKPRHLMITEEANRLFFNKPFLGENPSIFKYQVSEHEEGNIFRLHFFEDAKILIMF